MNEMNRFLKNLYDNLASEQIITKKVSTTKEKLTSLDNYLNKLDRIQTKYYDTDKLNKIKELYYNRYIIKEDEIPESYWHYLEKGHLERGEGHHNLVNPTNYVDIELRERYVENIRKKQIESLDSWLNYLMSPDANYLPTWAKVWAFLGMLKIGTYNKETNTYMKRTKNTVGPFIEINSELLGKSVEYLKQHLNHEEFSDEEIKQLASTESFSKIYTTLLSKDNKQIKNGNDGIWIKYEYKNQEDAKKLYESLQGYNTGWCTAASLSTAIDQVCGGKSYQGGDFYVYYTKDSENNYKIPRIAIRMDKNKIGEIRGVAKNQNLEPELERVLKEKLKEFPDAEEYQKKVSDMEKLTKIYKKHQNKEELTKDEIMFLYEIKGRIKGFGFQDDPRINEIKIERDTKKDLAYAFDCKEEEIGTPDEFKYKYLKVILGTVFMRNFKNESILMPECILGTLGYEHYSGQNKILPRFVCGNLEIYGTEIIENMILPMYVGYGLDLKYVKKIKNVTFPEYVGWGIALSNLEDYDKLVLPKYIGGALYLRGIEIAHDIVMFEYIKDSIYLSYASILKNVIFPRKIGKSLFLYKMKTFENVTFPEFIGDSLFMENISINDLLDINLPIVGGKIYIKEGTFTYEELKFLIAEKKDKPLLLTLHKENEDKKGYVNTLIVLLPALIILLGIFIAYMLIS